MSLQLDDHKLLFHLPVLSRWKEGMNIYPLTISIGPSRACNYRCVFCAYSYLDRSPIFLDTQRITKLAKETVGKGTRSFFFSGDGEPLMNKGLPDCIVAVKREGIDTALNTNGVLLTKEVSEVILPAMSWVRVSVNAGNPEKYASIHQTDGFMFERVLANLESAVYIKKSKGIACTIGIQALILSENLDTLKTLALELKQIGVDYFALKPFLHHPSISYQSPIDYNSKQVVEILTEIESYSSDAFNVVVRWNSLKKIVSRNYNRCLSFPFIVDIDSNGDVYPCGPQIGNKGFCYGNILSDSWDAIWNGKQKKELGNYLKDTFDCTDCMPNCRNDAVNRFLWKLNDTPSHVNFI